MRGGELGGDCLQLGQVQQVVARVLLQEGVDAHTALGVFAAVRTDLVLAWVQCHFTVELDTENPCNA